MNEQNPRNYIVPSNEEIETIKIGDLVKIIFKVDKSINNRFKDERIWVRVVDIEEGKFMGQLEEDVSQIERLRKGDVVSFEANNITTIKTKRKETVDESKSVAITNKAIQYRQINWVVKTTPLDRQDSGWQLFYGDEEYEYLNNPSNMKTITIKEVLDFEPLLENIFISRFDSAEYNSKVNKFMEI
jgi:hypothetical protein